METHFVLTTNQYGLDDTWAWVAPGPERQQVVAAGAPEVPEGAPVVDEGVLAVSAPVQAPQPPPASIWHIFGFGYGVLTPCTDLAVKKLTNKPQQKRDEMNEDSRFVELKPINYLEDRLFVDMWKKDMTYQRLDFKRKRACSRSSTAYPAEYIRRIQLVNNKRSCSKLDVVFDGEFGGVGDEEVVVGEGVVVISLSLDMLTNSCLGGIMVSLILLEGLDEEALVEFMVE
nr:hypothetical protein [Tanacetum cinerariifolium]